MKKRFFSDESAQKHAKQIIHAATEAPLLGRPAALGARVGGAAPHPGPRHRHQRFGRRGALLLGRGASFECRDAGAAEEIHVPMGVPQAACTWMHFAFECEAPEMVLEQQALAGGGGRCAAGGGARARARRAHDVPQVARSQAGVTELRGQPLGRAGRGRSSFSFSRSTRHIGIPNRHTRGKPGGIVSPAPRRPPLSHTPNRRVSLQVQGKIIIRA